MSEIKSYEDFKAEIERCGIAKVNEAEFPKSKLAPFVVYFRDGHTDEVYANGRLVFADTSIIIELYSGKKDLMSERTLEKWLYDNEIQFEKSERSWISQEKLCLTTYEIKMMFDE